MSGSQLQARPTATGDKTSSTVTRLPFRRDIEGLRAVAVLLVVGFHAFPSLVPGGYVGVDVFFVLSGFLITGLLVDEVRRTGSISIKNFYARRIRRLLPLSALTVVGTALLARFVVPAIDLPSTTSDLRAASLFFANWHFAASSTAYMATTDKSPVLHFWSLAVEEQFYVVWPALILVLVGGAASGRSWQRGRRRLAVGLAVLVGVSLFLSWWTSGTAGPWAYYGLHTRAWELGVGAGLALALPHLGTVTRHVRYGAALLGAALVVGSAFVYDAATTFPGIAATVPVLGCALLVASGAGLRPQEDAGVVSRLLSTAPMTYVGRISYSWYLWHWPMLVLLGYDADGSPSSARRRAALVAASFVVAAVASALVERPVRQSKALTGSPRRSLVFGGVLTVVTLVAATGLTIGLARTGDVVSLRALTAPDEFSRSGSPASANGARTPATARADAATAPPGCYVGPALTTVGSSCLIGDPNGTKTVVLVGDSKAAQWIPAMDRLGRTNHWKVHVWAKAFCPLSDIEPFSNGRPYDECPTWRQGVLDRIHDLGHVDLIVTGHSSGYLDRILLPNGTRTTPQTAGAAWQEATTRTLASLRATQAQVVVIRETPWPGQNVPTCLSQAGAQAEKCGFDRDQATGRDDPLVAAERAAGQVGALPVSVIDPNPQICPAATCRVVDDDGTVIYRDDQHITATYALGLVPWLDASLTRALESASAPRPQ